MIEIKMMLITFNRGSLHSSPMLCCVSKMPSTLKSAHHCSNWFPIVGLQPRWLLGFSLCRRWRGFWPGCQPREAVVVYLSNIAQDWDEQSGKRPRHFGRRSQLSGHTLIFLFLTIHIYWRTSFPYQRRFLMSKWIGSLYNLFKQKWVAINKSSMIPHYHFKYLQYIHHCDTS